jgi:hypothetical protein
MARFRPQCAPLVLLLTWAAGPVLAQPSATLAEAKAAWDDAGKRRGMTWCECRDSGDARFAYFRNSRLFLDPSATEAKLREAGYQRVGAGTVPKGGPIAAKSLTPGECREGDVVLLSHEVAGRTVRLALVYVGEGTFPTGRLRFSFFIYPLVTRLEQNTFPPREHKELYEKYPFARVVDKVTGEGPARFTPEADRDVYWRLPVSGQIPFSDTHFEGTPFTVYRYQP